MHLLDLVESSARAGATLISVSISRQAGADLLAIELEDNGWGPEPGRAQNGCSAVSDWTGVRPLVFLDCCEAATRQAGGSFSIRRSGLGGLRLNLQLPLSRLERDPLADLASLLASVVCTHQGVDLACRVCVGEQERRLRVSDLMLELSERDQVGLGLARLVAERLKTQLEELGVAAG